MSQENLEVAKAVIETWNARDMDALREYYDPGVILRTLDGWPEPGHRWRSTHPPRLAS